MKLIKLTQTFQKLEELITGFDADTEYLIQNRGNSAVDILEGSDATDIEESTFTIQPGEFFTFLKSSDYDTYIRSIDSKLAVKPLAEE